MNDTPPTTPPHPTPRERPATGLRRVVPTHRERLYRAATSRRIEQAAAAHQPQPPLMERAGTAVARLAAAWAPHAREIWVACGPGNNGGDGLVAARWLHTRGRGAVRVWMAGPPEALPSDARAAWQAAVAAGVAFTTDGPTPGALVIDALLGLGVSRAPTGALAEALARVHDHTGPVLCVDLPSGLHPDSGTAWLPERPTAGPRATLALLSLKPGLFTGRGRDLSGEVWFDDLGVSDPGFDADAHWGGHTPTGAGKHGHPHAGHKGRYGDVIVLGGESVAVHGAGMTGAALLAARAALQAGAGRVFAGLLGPVSAQPGWDPGCLALMLRTPQRLCEPKALRDAAVVLGCGGGESVAPLLAPCIAHADALVLDADALNALAREPAAWAALRSRRGPTVLTPHPLEAARLLGTDTARVMDGRLAAAQALSERSGAIVVLKGSGTVVAMPDAAPWINATGNASLATGGTGDVLAGALGAALAVPGRDPLEATRRAVAAHGAAADAWSGPGGLTADALAALLTAA